MAKDIKFSEDARAAMLRGVDILADTIAKEIELEDRFENMGAKLVSEVASKTNDIAGDGTTTATVLTQAIVREGLKNVTAGANPVGIRRGIELATQAAVKGLAEISQTVNSKESIAQVAAVSSGSKEIRQRRSHHDRRVKRDRNRVGCCGRDAIRPRLPIAIHGHQQRQNGSRIGSTLYPDHGS